MSEHIFKIGPHGEGEEEAKKAKRAKKAKGLAFLPSLPFLSFLFPSAFQLKELTLQKRSDISLAAHYASISRRFHVRERRPRLNF
jgi:hypothetical protein